MGISRISTGSCPSRCRQDILDPYTYALPSNRRLGNLMLTVDSMHSYTGPRSERYTRDASGDGRRGVAIGDKIGGIPTQAGLVLVDDGEGMF